MTEQEIESRLQERASKVCEMCGATEGLQGLEIPGSSETSSDAYILACSVCREQITGQVPLDNKHWFCLKESCWSEVAAVQVASYRLLTALSSEGWAQDVLGQMYLMDEVQAWADAAAGTSESDEQEEVITLDSNGTVLAEGDSVTLIQDLPVKGAGFTAKRGTMVRGIHMIDDPDNIEGRINKMTLVLKTKFLKKVN